MEMVYNFLKKVNIWFKKYELDIRFFSSQVSLMIGISLLTLGVYTFTVGFHALDIVHNVLYLSYVSNKPFFEYSIDWLSENEYIEVRNEYIYGVNLMFYGGLLLISGSFLTGLSINDISSCYEISRRYRRYRRKYIKEV